MKNTVLGILAHVDAGKTSMAEAMLYTCGSIKSLGRVDHKNAFLDTNRLEKERGITIFSKQAVFDVQDLRINLLDTPGHMDFSSEMERTLSVLDYALLVISGPDGVQAHTQTLWNLLRRYHVPTFIWVNKMDICESSPAELCEHLRKELGSGIIDFSGDLDYEMVAESDEDAIEEYLEMGRLSDATIADLIRRRKIFPCYFGSALKLEKVDAFLAGFARYVAVAMGNSLQCAAPCSIGVISKACKDECSGKSGTAQATQVSTDGASSEFGARVFKITRDDSGEKLSWMKITGGALKVRTMLGDDKVTQIRSYSGAKYQQLDEATVGSVVAVCGLASAYAGKGLGFEPDAKAPVLEPVLSYRIELPAGTDVQGAFKKLSQLSEEDPMLRIVWEPQLREIQAQLMGEVQIEVLQEIIKDRYGYDVTIGQGRIVYKETIASPVEGVGHFEPLRHYAEVHLLMEPLAPGTGIIFESMCSTDELDLNWQRLILTNLAEKEHIGVLTGSPITDIKISVIAGRAHLKHTEGGDFRQATYRAVRQGLMKAENVLLEPFYDFTLVVPSDQLGRAISDLKSMQASFSAPKDLEGSFSITGRGPVATLGGYQIELLSYTKGKGRISCHFAGYYPCHNTAKVVEACGYEPERDVENSPDSVFCSHGAGVTVKWDHVQDFMHLDSGLKLGSEGVSEVVAPKLRTGNMDFDEKELEAIMLREFGPIKRPRYSNTVYDYNKEMSTKDIKKRYLIVDGYNIIFSWDELKVLAKDSIGHARDRLIDILSNFKAYKNIEMVLVFDGYKVPENPGSKEERGGLNVVYTKEGQTADSWIESFIHEIGKNYSVSIATSDGLIQLAALRLGVMRMSSRELLFEVQAVQNEIKELLLENETKSSQKFRDNSRRMRSIQSSKA